MIIKKNNQDGFTLWELLIVLAIISIISLAAFASFRLFIDRKHATNYMLSLASALNYAKAEAILKNKTITMCPSLDKKSCNTINWNKNIIIFVDYKSDRKLESKDKILKVLDLVAKGDRLNWSGFPSKRYIQFMGTGLLNVNNGTFIYCPRGNVATIARALFISKTGRIRFSDDSNKDLIHEASNGKNLSCA